MMRRLALWIAGRLMRIAVKLAQWAERKKPAAQVQVIPVQPLRGIVEQTTSDGEPYWTLRIYNAFDGSKPHWYMGLQNVADILSSANLLRDIGGIEYTINGVPQREE